MSDQEVADAELGREWRLTEAALPEGWAIDRLIRRWDTPEPGEWWRVAANRGDGSFMWGGGASKVRALRDLREKLKAQR